MLHARAHVGGHNSVVGVCDVGGLGRGHNEEESSNRQEKLGKMMTEGGRGIIRSSTSIDWQVVSNREN